MSRDITAETPPHIARRGLIPSFQMGVIFVVCVVGFRRGLVGELLDWQPRRGRAE